MNMKKTMAAIAAGAVAVSAMATSVSALADKTLTYNLVETVVEKGTGEVTLTARFTNLDLTDATSDILKLSIGNKFNKVKSVSITGRNTLDNAALTPLNLATGNDQENYSRKVDENGNVYLRIGAGLDVPAAPITLVVSYVVEHATDLSGINTNIQPVTAIAGSTAKSTDDVLDAANTFTAGSELGTGVVQAVSASNFQGQGETKHEFPLATSLTANTNIIYYLETAAVNPSNTRAAGSYSTHGKTYTATDATYGSYYNVGAVLNDAVANYEGVVFKFNTASKRVANGSVDSWYAQVGEYIRDDWYDKGKSDDYSKFAEHLYNGTNNVWNTSYGTEKTGYTGYDWAGYNLFQGALVVNENLTMSLSDTEFFDWQGTSISFDWDSIYSNAMTSNNFATYVQSLKLATSSLWYWESMDVELTAGAAEDASSGAGATGDDDTLDDGDDDGDDISLDDDGDDDDSDIAGDDDDDDGDDIDTDTNDTQAPAQTASNPQTGNASVALAVIPVALAAAAIVAKKRG